MAAAGQKPRTIIDAHNSETLLDPQLRPTANFVRFAGLTLVHADKLDSTGRPERQVVSNARREEITGVSFSGGKASSP